VSPEGITSVPEKLKAARELPTLKKKREIRMLLDLCTYYKRFVSSFANIGKRLTKLTEDKQAFQWTPPVTVCLILYSISVLNTL
jgi:hypothetical protein